VDESKAETTTNASELSVADIPLNKDKEKSPLKAVSPRGATVVVKKN